jgi:peptidoglycan/LPS O-acetylase OafA/YrhL
VLSGFVLAHAYGGGLHARSDLQRFAWRRIGRLWPLHVCLLACFVVIELVLLAAQSRGLLAGFRPAFSDTSPASAIPTNLALVQALGFHDSPTFNRPSWSISTELYGNLLLGLMWLLVPARRAVHAAAAVAVASALVVLVFSPDYMRTVVGLAFFRCLYGLMAGCLVHELHCRLKDGRLPAPTLVEVTALAAVVLYVHIAGDGVWTMLAPLVFAAGILVFAREAGALSRLFTTSPFLKLGDWSYSIYMVHYLVLVLIAIVARLAETMLGVSLMEPVQVGAATIKLFTAGGKLAMDLATIAYLGVVVLIAAGTYRLIEMPARAWFNARSR